MYALEGMKVLDLSRVLAGPWCTQTLADLGADVWKVEEPTRGDETRTWMPPQIGDESTYFLCANRSKRSLAIDLKHPEGQALVRRMALEADVLVENFRAGVLESFGLDYATLSELNPALIYCSISGYGRTGSRAHDAGYDAAIQAECGLMAITGEPEGSPMKVGVAIVDVVTGMAATQAILAAYIFREKTGKGQWIDMSLHACGVSLLANVASAHLATGNEAKRFGNGHAAIVPYQTFATGDSHMVVAVGNDKQFRLLCGLIAMPELSDDARFVTNALRVQHRDELIVQLQIVFKTRSTQDWIALFKEKGIPCGAVYKVSDVFASPESVAQGYFADVEDPVHGILRIPASPLKFSLTPIRVPQPPPRLGEHTAELLKETIGLTDEEVKGLHYRNILR